MIRIARAEAKRLAVAVNDSTDRLDENHMTLAQLTEELFPGLQSVAGVGPVMTAIIICVYSHDGRIRLNFCHQQRAEGSVARGLVALLSSRRPGQSWYWRESAEN